jgi:hypothetical protein
MGVVRVVPSLLGADVPERQDLVNARGNHGGLGVLGGGEVDETTLYELAVYAGAPGYRPLEGLVLPKGDGVIGGGNHNVVLRVEPKVDAVKHGVVRRAVVDFARLLLVGLLVLHANDILNFSRLPVKYPNLAAPLR